jgi:hypothetical protein
LNRVLFRARSRGVIVVVVVVLVAVFVVDVVVDGRVILRPRILGNRRAVNVRADCRSKSGRVNGQSFVRQVAVQVKRFAVTNGS